MMHDIKKFGADLQSIHDENLHNPPLTYEAYNAALVQYLYEFKITIINTEKDIMKQGIKTNAQSFVTIVVESY